MNLLNNKQFWEEFFEEFVKECKELYNKKGFNYDIPKEDQIRVSLYSSLRKKGFFVELESNLFINEKYRKKYQATPRFDLRVIMNDYDLLIEIKRTTALDTWFNDYTNYLKSWKKDIEKFEKFKDLKKYDLWKIKSNPKRCFLLGIFTHNNDKSEKELEKLNLKIKEFKDFIHDTWQGYETYETNPTSLGNYKSRFTPTKEETREAMVKFIIWMEK